MAFWFLLVITIFIQSLLFYSQAKQNGIDSFKCVNINHQPAFTHPKLKHHKLQFEPNIPHFPGVAVSRVAFINETEGCPDGKVPIQTNPSIQPLHDINSGARYFATISTSPAERTYRGGAATMSVFNPQVGLMQSTKGNIWVQNGPQESDLNSIEVGWAVHPNLYGDNYTRLTTYWTVDNFQTTGCYNVLCPGFVQVDNSLFLGQAYLIDRYYPLHIEQIAILQDNVTGNWWVVTQIDRSLILPIGYWPKEIFTYLALGAEVVKYGGTTSTYLEELDAPPMGNGNYPGEIGWSVGFFIRIRYVIVVNESYMLVDASEMNEVLDSVCYGLMYFNAGIGRQETIMYGGPGGRAEKCIEPPLQ